MKKAKPEFQLEQRVKFLYNGRWKYGTIGALSQTGCSIRIDETGPRFGHLIFSWNDIRGELLLAKCCQ